MWIKLLLGCAVVAFGVLVGYLAAGKWRARKKFFLQFSQFNERYLTELGYSRKPLTDFLKAYAYTGEFGKLVEKFAARRETDTEGLAFLTKEERAETEDYFKTLGAGDSLSQRSYFTARKSVLENKKTESGAEAKKRGELYIKLGLLSGLAALILIL